MEKKYVFAVLEGTLNYCGVEIKFEVTYYVKRGRLDNDIIVRITKNSELLKEIFRDTRRSLGLPDWEHSTYIDELFQKLKKYYNFPEKVTEKHYKVKYRLIKVVPAEQIIAKILDDMILEKL